MLARRIASCDPVPPSTPPVIATTPATMRITNAVARTARRARAVRSTNHTVAIWTNTTTAPSSRRRALRHRQRIGRDDQHEHQAVAVRRHEGLHEPRPPGDATSLARHRRGPLYSAEAGMLPSIIGSNVAAVIRGWRDEPRGGRLVVQDVEHRAPGCRDDREDRYGQEHPGNPRHRCAGRDGEQHDRRMQVHRAVVDERRDDIALDEIEHDRVDEHDRDLRRTAVRDRDQEGQAGGDESAVVRDEARDEGQDRDRDRERQAQDQHDRELRDGADRGDDRRAEHVAAQDVHGVAAGPIERDRVASRSPPGSPSPSRAIRRGGSRRRGVRTAEARPRSQRSPRERPRSSASGCPRKSRRATPPMPGSRRHRP